MVRIIGFLFLILFVISGVLDQPGCAETSTKEERPWEKFSINLGGFLTALDSSLRVGGEAVGVDIDVEELLDLDSEKLVFRADAHWRFSENFRHRLDLSWFSFRRDGSQRVLDDFEVEREDGSIVTIPTGTTVESSFDIDFYRLAYSYSFYQDDRVDLAAGLGVSIVPVDIELRASGLLDSGDAVSFTAPLPVIGLRAEVAITPRWFLRFGSQLFYLEYEDFKGTLVNASTNLEYCPFKHVGFGLGVESLRLAIEAEGEDYPGIDLEGKIGFNYTGVALYTKIIF